MAQRIVILGGGYAGVTAGLRLRKQYKGNAEVEIVLVNKHTYHIFTPSLYEVATSESPMKNIAIPLTKIFPDTVNLIKGTVEKIDAAAKKVSITGQEPLSYDYLIVTLGSQAAYYGIPGLKEHSIPFKSLNNAVTIQETINGRCMIEHGKKKNLEVVIGGGGFAGTELAAEILTYRRKIARENKIDQDCINTTVIQGSDRVLKELDEHVSRLAAGRLKEKGMTMAFGGHIKEVTATEVLTDDGKHYPYDILIWTGGVEANHLASESNLPVTKRGQIIVDTNLKMQDSDCVFAAGDVAGFIDPKTQKPVPNVAQVAEEMGVAAAENVIRSREKKPLKPYQYRHFGYIVPLKGRFAVAELMGGIHFDGLLGWSLQQLVFLQYLLRILPLGLALKRWNVFELELEQ